MDLPSITVPQPADGGSSALLPLASLSDRLGDATPREVRFHLSWEPSVAEDEAAAWLETPEATALFLAAFAKMTVALSEPDVPDVDEHSTTHGGLQAIWDFDYHRWRLWLEERSDGHSVVLLERSSAVTEPS